MSLLFVSYDKQKNDFVTVQITRMAAKFLFSHVLEPLAKFVEDDEFLDKAEADLVIENVSFYRLMVDEFHHAYDLVEKNSNHPILEPYAKELLAKMQADPRFEHAHA